MSACTCDYGGHHGHREACPEYGASLVRWLRAKWERHKELEDKMAADLLESSLSKLDAAKTLLEETIAAELEQVTRADDAEKRCLDLIRGGEVILAERDAALSRLDALPSRQSIITAIEEIERCYKRGDYEHWMQDDRSFVAYALDDMKRYINGGGPIAGAMDRLDAARTAYRAMIAGVDVCDRTKETQPIRSELVLDLEDALYFGRKSEIRGGVVETPERKYDEAFSNGDRQWHKCAEPSCGMAVKLPADFCSKHSPE